MELVESKERWEQLQDEEKDCLTVTDRRVGVDGS